MVHCLSLCVRWRAEREGVEMALKMQAAGDAQRFAHACLRGDVSVEALACLVEWAFKMDRDAAEFWK